MVYFRGVRTLVNGLAHGILEQEAENNSFVCIYLIEKTFLNGLVDPFLSLHQV